MVLYTLTSLPLMPRPGTQALAVSRADKIYIFQPCSLAHPSEIIYVMICIQLLVCRAVVEIFIVNVRLHIFNNLLVIWDKVTLDESDIVNRLTQSTRNTVMPAKLLNLILYLATF